MEYTSPDHIWNDIQIRVLHQHKFRNPFYYVFDVQPLHVHMSMNVLYNIFEKDNIIWDLIWAGVNFSHASVCIKR